MTHFVENEFNFVIKPITHYHFSLQNCYTRLIGDVIFEAICYFYTVLSLNYSVVAYESMSIHYCHELSTGIFR